MTLIPDLREFIERLNSANVRFLVIGGWAFNRYGEPRYTGNLDGIPVHFISARHLIVNKKAAGRPKDLADLVILERPMGERSE
jgi:hypothetical protein